MTFEVEQKFAVDDPGRIRTALESLGASIGETILQVDTYYAHPCRDFAQTDEAVRIRQVGDGNRITYKGPKLDRATKTRKEIELPLGPGEQQAEQWDALLQALGFAPVTQVRKTRTCGTLRWQDSEVEIALDQVDRVGNYIELELTAEDDGLQAAQQCILALCTHLGLSGAERRSYLELLLARQSASPSDRADG